jgi:hypothetical protein
MKINGQDTQSRQIDGGRDREVRLQHACRSRQPE